MFIVFLLYVWYFFPGVLYNFDKALKNLRNAPQSAALSEKMIELKLQGNRFPFLYTNEEWRSIETGEGRKWNSRFVSKVSETSRGREKWNQVNPSRVLLQNSHLTAINYQFHTYRLTLKFNLIRTQAHFTLDAKVVRK